MLYVTPARSASPVILLSNLHHTKLYSSSVHKVNKHNTQIFNTEQQEPEAKNQSYVVEIAHRKDYHVR